MRERWSIRFNKNNKSLNFVWLQRGAADNNMVNDDEMDDNDDEGEDDG